MFKISIITVSKNAENTIKNTIVSVISQTYPHIEYIVIDGKSSDTTVNIIETYKNHIHYFISEEDNGIYEAMNKGINVSKGDILFFLNADDHFVDNHVVEDVVDIFMRENVDIVFGNQLFNLKFERSIKKQQFSDVKIQLAKSNIQHQTIFAKRKVFQLTKGFSENFKVIGDYDWMIKAFLVHNCSYKYIDRDISLMSTNGLSWVTDFEKERLEIMKKYYSYFDIYRYRIIPVKYARLKKYIKSIFNVV